MNIEAMKQALEALKDFGNHRHDCPQWPTYTEPEKYPACDCGYDKALKSIDQAIAVAEQHTEAEKQKEDAVGFCEVLTMDDVADIVVNAQKRTPPYEINYMIVMQLTEKKVLEKFK